uniref:Uncharacterized protein n=1 Tax=Physcomitrium patens TaxID=3218 RepID=A0A2K1L8A0_PHYPA|nr:hypothetical protein PHYPA_000681 [Physcomitrium patens]
MCTAGKIRSGGCACCGFSGVTFIHSPVIPRFLLASPQPPVTCLLRSSSRRLFSFLPTSLTLKVPHFILVSYGASPRAGEIKVNDGGKIHSCGGSWTSSSPVQRSLGRFCSGVI